MSDHTFTPHEITDSTDEFDYADDPGEDRPKTIRVDPEHVEYEDDGTLTITSEHATFQTTIDLDEVAELLADDSIENVWIDVPIEHFVEFVLRVKAGEVFTDL